MALYPEVQKKARAELETVVGLSRLPNITDRHRLPYVEAVVKEILRWHTAVPLNAPHLSTEDDAYNGFFIPKDTTVLVNMW